MKKSLLALAALTAFAGAASAQSSVTMYGRVDLSVGQQIGSDSNFLANGSGSRLGLRGVEDLGGGMKAIFNIETRFNADTGSAQNVNIGGYQPIGGAATTSNRFWGARSIVGLQGGWGEISLGREYTTSFLQNQLAADPWGWDTIVATNNSSITRLGSIGQVRNDSAITWKFAAGGFSLHAQYSEATDEINKWDANPFNVAVGYGAGPFVVNFAYEKTGAEQAGDEDMWSIFAGWNFGAFRLTGWYGDGTTRANADHTGWLVAATMPLGQAELRASYGQLEANDTKVVSGLSLGYHYALSKRTTIYADWAMNSELKKNDYGYDFGIKHNF
jgi:predicted porin